MIGLPICDCPSAGHDLLFLDYRKNGRNGAPQVSHVDQEYNYRITLLADTFEEYLSNLDNRKNFMSFINIVELEKYNNKTMYEFIETGIYHNLITDKYVITLKTEIESKHNTQYPLEDLLERYYVNCTEYTVVEEVGDKVFYTFEIESDERESIYEFKNLIGKTAYNYLEGGFEKIGFE